MSIAPSSSPSSRWSRGVNPSASKSRGLPIVSTTVKSSSPPRGTSSNTRFGNRDISASNAAPVVSASAWADFTAAASSLVRASTAAFSSPWARATCLPSSFCSARRASKDAIPARRASSAATRASTSSGDSPRASWERRTRSGSVRSSFGSITIRKPSVLVPAPLPGTGSTAVTVLAGSSTRRHPCAPSRPRSWWAGEPAGDEERSKSGGTTRPRGAPGSRTTAAPPRSRRR